MRDENNPNIEYKQISVLLILLFIVFIFLVIAALSFTILTLYTHIFNAIDKNENHVFPIIGFSILFIFLTYSMVINFIVMSKAYHLSLDEHIILYTLLTYISLNIPCAIIIHKSIRKVESDD